MQHTHSKQLRYKKCPAIFHINVTSKVRRKGWRKAALASAEKVTVAREL
jgi:hypothetical protein